MTMTTKKCLAAICAVTLLAADAFVPRTTSTKFGRDTVVLDVAQRPPSVPGPFQSMFSMKWLELEERANEFKRNPDDEMGYILVKEMLDLALNAVQSAEIDEENHVAKARKELKRAVDTERELELAAQELHIEASDADNVLENFQQKEVPASDYTYRHQMAASDIAHRVENYVESRLEAAREAEEAAKKEEFEATKNLNQLLANENELRTCLAELKAVREKMTKKP